jgi:hypothetical protein
MKILFIVMNIKNFNHLNNKLHNFKLKCNNYIINKPNGKVYVITMTNNI